jgi:heme A synthase
MSLHRYAKLTAFVTFVLLLVGGLVHNTRSSLACPDWPLCFGQVFPRREGGVLVEHSHRLLATTVGLLTIGLLIGLVKRAQRTGERNLIVLGSVALFCVVFQGLLGGLTVLYRLPTWISTTHLAVSMIFFSLLIYIAYRTRERAGRQPLSASVRRATALAAGAVYAQMILGALMRHLGAGLACVELPLCQGSAWGAHWAVQVHMLHRWLAVA